MLCRLVIFFFNDTATTEIYTLSLHDALPISPLERPSLEPTYNPGRRRRYGPDGEGRLRGSPDERRWRSSSYQDRKSTRLNSSHANISYAVFCLKKKKDQVTYVHPQAPARSLH